MNTRHWMRYPLMEAEGGEGGGGGGEGDDKGKEGEGDLGTMEERAQRMGWTPKEKFRGDPERWVDAKTFVKNGEESLPILRERLRKMESTTAEQARAIKEAREFNEKVYEKAYAKAKKDLEGEVKKAAKAGDDEGAAAAANELAELEAEKAERKASKGKDADPEFEAWELANDWYKDPDLREEAEVQAFRLRRKGEKSEGSAFLDKVKEAVKKQFPEKFGNPRRQAGNGVERPSGGGEGGGNGGKKGWENLPADAKEAGERFIKQKLVKDKATYAQQYWEQN